MAIPFFRLVCDADDGASIFECLHCRSQWESRTSPDKWKWCPYCGCQMKGVLSCREKSDPKWRFFIQQQGKSTYGLHVHCKTVVPVFGVEERTIDSDGKDVEEWHLVCISDQHYAHTAKSIHEFVVNKRQLEAEKLVEDQRNHNYQMSHLDEDYHELYARGFRESMQMTEFRVILVADPTKVGYDVERIYNFPEETNKVSLA